MGSETRERSQVVAVRLTPDEKAEFAAFAARQGKSLPDLMRLAVEAALLEDAIGSVRARPDSRGL